MILKILIVFFILLILYSILSNLVNIEGLETKKEQQADEEEIKEETKEEKEMRIKKEKELEKQRKIEEEKKKKEEERRKLIEMQKQQMNDLNSKIEDNSNNYKYLYNQFKSTISTDKDLSLLEKKNTNNSKKIVEITNKLQNKAIDVLGGDPRETVKKKPKATGLSISKNKYKELEKEITPPK